MEQQLIFRFYLYLVPFVFLTTVSILRIIVLNLSVKLSLKLTKNDGTDYENHRTLHSDGEGKIKLCGETALSLFWNLKPVVATDDEGFSSNKQACQLAFLLLQI